MDHIDTLRERVDALENHVRRVERRLRWRRSIACSLLVGLTALVLIFPGPAAAIDPASYLHVDVNYPAPFGGAAGGYISCPAGTKAVASGVTLPGRENVITTGLTTFDGNGAFATAAVNPGHLQISVRCVDAAQVQNSTLVTKSIRDHRGEFYQAGKLPGGNRRVWRRWLPQSARRPTVWRELLGRIEATRRRHRVVFRRHGGLLLPRHRDVDQHALPTERPVRADCHRHRDRHRASGHSQLLQLSAALRRRALPVRIRVRGRSVVASTRLFDARMGRRPDRV
jgi:hypothetical protein